jgi:23S rRNA pseudouridine1911/1915/1917 synthase
MDQESQPTTQTIFATNEDRKKRTDLFLTEHLQNYSRSKIQNLLKEGHISLRGAPVRARDEVQPGDLFILAEPPPKPLAKAFPENIPLEIIYEDEDLLVINKPAGRVVHLGAHHEKGTIVNALLHHSISLSAKESFRPGLVHRLDKETSGCLLVAKNDLVHASLSRLFLERKISKTYLAITTGCPRQKKGTISLPIGRHPVQRLKMTVRRPPSGRDAITDYEVLAATATHALLACSPHTGRMHQIRVHLQQLGHAIVGDPLYGKRDHWQRHLLHAWKLEFPHPKIDKNIIVEAPLPVEFELVPWKTKKKNN